MQATFDNGKQQSTINNIKTMSEEYTKPTTRCGDFTDVDHETDTILKARIEPSTHGIYANGNICFMIWLYGQSHKYHQYVWQMLVACVS